MKTAELTSPMLDYWVAKADGRENVKIWSGRCFCDHPHSLGTGFMPTQYWGVGGPIIERERIEIGPAIEGNWYAEVDPYNYKWASRGKAPEALGPTPLVAAMRAFVASKYGEQVPE